MPRPRALHRVGSGAFQVAAGFGAVLLAGFVLLLMPFSSDGEGFASVTTALFTAVSALCVTGLIVADTSTHWSATGEIVILLLIQVGGLGYMSGTTLILWALGRRLGIRDRHMLRLYYGAPSMRETLHFVRAVALFSLAFEAAGALLLTVAFLLADVSPGRALWWGVFHSVSAFNNAGLALTENSMVGYSGDPLILTTISVLVIAGGLGYFPIIALVRRHDFGRLPLDPKLVFVTSAVLLALGFVFVMAAEWTNDESIGGLPAAERPGAAFFHSVNSRSSGFTTVDLGAMHDETKVGTIGLMFVGGAAGSTAGGLRVGAFALLLAVMLSTIRGRDDVTLFDKRLPPEVIRQATTLALYYVAILFGFSLLLTVTTEQPFIDVLFEAMSAIGTVGFSSLGTPGLSAAGHFVLILAMLVGRFGSLMLVLHMNRPRRRPPFLRPVDSVRLG